MRQRKIFQADRRRGGGMAGCGAGCDIGLWPCREVWRAAAALAHARRGSDDDALTVRPVHAACGPCSASTLYICLEPLVGQPFRAHVYFSVPRIIRNLRANPIGNLQDLIRLREFNFGQYNALQNIVVDIDHPSSVFMDDEVPHLVQNIPGAHRSQDFFGVGAGYRILKFCSNHTHPTTFQGNGCFVVCDANSDFIAVVARYQPVSNF
jgi:hypothetical protein